jgi:uncharacterized protein YndB with AHSA1/START domain
MEAKSSPIFSVKPKADTEIEIMRVFDAPRPLVFDAMTKCDILKHWFYGPDGWTLAVCDIDLRVGGEYRYVWRKEKTDTDMGMGGVYREIEAPKRIVATEKFDDPWYEGEAIGTTELTENGGRTTLTINVKYDSQEIRDSVLRSPMEEGLSTGYDRLANLLASMK